MKQVDVTAHFDKIAKYYDSYKKNHAYYFNFVKRGLKKRIPKGKRILDYGCGTGSYLHALSPSHGVGYDLSQGMLKIAKEKYANNKNLFFTKSVNMIKGNFDFIICVDAIEHFSNTNKEFKIMRQFMSYDTKLVVSYVDNRWDWLINLLGSFKKKTPEGPYKRIKRFEVISAAENAGLKLVSPIPFGLIDVFIFEKK